MTDSEIFLQHFIITSSLSWLLYKPPSIHSVQWPSWRVSSFYWCLGSSRLLQVRGSVSSFLLKALL